jgi:predicted RecB family nuclease
VKITVDLFNAYLRCPTKCWLRSGGEPRGTSSWADWAQSNGLIYRREGIKQLVGDIPSVEAGEPKSWKAAGWLFAVDVTVQAFSPSDSYTLESLIDAVKRVSPPGRAKVDKFIPVRFCPANKLTKYNRLILAFDAWVISQALGYEVSWGLIIHGDRYIDQRVNTIPLMGEVRKLVGELAALLASKGAPDLALNRHCVECEFRNRCRKLAIEKDDLSLLDAMTEKERSKLHRKGIFTVTQLSYTFRPRKRSRRSANQHEQYHHSLKALAIREKKIHMVGVPEAGIEGTAIYLDVEGIPDRNFYYLIGLRVRFGEQVQQHSFWAENPAEEKEIWIKFLGILATVQNPVLVHYGSYERGFIKQMCGRYGGPKVGSIVDLALRSSVNVLALLFSKIYLPTYSNRLKDTAAYFGATWRSPAITGIQTIALRSEWERTRSDKLKENLLAYNQDDCAAVELLSQEIEKLVAESESRPDVDFAYSPKKAATESGSEIHATLEGLLKTAWLDYTRNKITIRKSGVETSNALTTPSCTRKWKLRKLPRSGGQVIRVPRKRKCPNHPEHPTMLRPASKDKEHAILDITFMQTGCRKTILRYRGKQSYCPRCGSRYSPPQV